MKRAFVELDTIVSKLLLNRIQDGSWLATMLDILLFKSCARVVVSMNEWCRHFLVSVVLKSFPWWMIQVTRPCIPQAVMEPTLMRSNP